MYARATVAQFQPDASEEAMHIIRDIILPSAQTQPGFKSALILRTVDSNRGIIISFWDTEAELLASSPPDEIVPYVERLGELIAEATQDTYEVVHQM